MARSQRRHNNTAAAHAHCCLFSICIANILYRRGRSGAHRSEKLTADSGIAFAGRHPSAETFAHGVTLLLKEKVMNTRRLFTLLAAILVTTGQSLVVVTSTTASAEAQPSSIATLVQSDRGLGEV